MIVSKTVNKVLSNFSIHAIAVKSINLIIKARPIPINLNRLRLSGGSLSAKMEIKIRLSTPKIISNAIKDINGIIIS